MIKTMMFPNNDTIIQDFVLENNDGHDEEGTILPVEDCCCTNSESNTCGPSSRSAGPMHHSLQEKQQDQQQLQQRNTRVRFAEAIVRHEVLSLDDYSNTELGSSWYSSIEKKAMAARRAKVLGRLESGKQCNEDKATYRGLECWTSIGADDLSDNINRVIQVVMQEQERQKAAGMNLDAKLIALKSQAVTGLSLQRALELAQTDESEANRINLGPEQQETFADGISWYRPQKRGKRRGVKHDILAGNHKLTDCRSRRRARRSSIPDATVPTTNHRR